MISLFKKGKKKDQRSLTGPEDLQTGDIIVLKERRSLPLELQGLQLEVTHVGTYQYSDGMKKELTLRSVDDKTYFLSVNENDDGPGLCFSIKVSRKAVLAIFDEDEFGQLWEPDYVTLQVNNKPEKYAAWLSDDYKQDVCEAEGYYYDRDCADKPPSDLQDDDGEEFRYHECTSMQDDNYSLSVEVWADGDTEVFLEVTTPVDVIAEMWPHGD